MSNIAPLYQVADQYRAMAERLADLSLPAEVIADTLEGEIGPLAERATAVGFVIRNLESAADALDAEIRRLTDRKAAYTKRIESVERYLKQGMEIAGITKIESPLFDLRIQRNPPSVDVFDASQVPAAFMRQPAAPPPAPDKKAIAAEHKAGRDVPGTRPTQTTRLVIG